MSITWNNDCEMFCRCHCVLPSKAWHSRRVGKRPETTGLVLINSQNAVQGWDHC